MGKRKANLKDSCACCTQTDCVNLFKRSDEDPLVGGEFYVYNQLTHSRIQDEQLEQDICSNGRLLECSCFIVTTLNELFPGDYLAVVCNEVVRDMKSSFYLAMSGHYRQAVIIQRCVFENFLYGLYFFVEQHVFSRDDNDRNDVYKQFQNWIKGEFRKSDKDLREIIQRGKLITKDEQKEWGKLFGKLSEFVHTIRRTPTGRLIKHSRDEIKFEIKGCYSEVEFNKEELIEWSAFYQRVIFLILYKLLILFPDVKKEDAGILALRFLRAEFKDSKRRSHDPYLDDILKMRGRKMTQRKV